MTKVQFHRKAGKYQTHVLNLDGADIEYHPGFIESAEAWRLFEKLRSLTDWQQHRISLYGKTHNVPRLSLWVADAGLAYSYSNLQLQPEAWTPLLRQLRKQVELAANHHFNSVLLNYYRDGQDSNGWHSDDEPELGKNPLIASLSLGGARDFQLRHKTDRELRETLSLENGSLLLMKGRSQHCWQHHVPKRASAAARINLTFRTVFTRS